MMRMPRHFWVDYLAGDFEGEIFGNGLQVRCCLTLGTAFHLRLYSDNLTNLKPRFLNSGTAAITPSAVLLFGWFMCMRTIEEGEALSNAAFT